MNIRKIDKPSQTNDMVTSVNLIYSGNVFSTLHVPCRMTHEDVIACDPYVHQAKLTCKSEMGPTLTLVSQVSRTCPVSSPPRTPLEETLIGTPSFSSKRDGCYFSLIFYKVQFLTFHETGPVHVPYVRQTEPYLACSARRIPIRLRSLLWISFALMIFIPFSRCLTYRGPNSLIEALVCPTHFHS